MENCRLDIVVAHYNEDLNWLLPYAPQTMIYSKGSPPAEGVFSRVKQLPNIGRESHTFLYHLVNSYDELADITMFTQGDVYNLNSKFTAHTTLSLDEMVLMLLNTPRYGMTSFSPLKVTFKDWDGIRWIQPGEKQWLRQWGSSLVPARLSPGEFWQYIHGGDQPPRALRVHANGLFGVRAEAVRRRPKEFYQRILEYFDNIGACNIEEGIYMERMWFGLFSESHIIRGESTALITNVLKVASVPYSMDLCAGCKEQNAPTKTFIQGCARESGEAIQSEQIMKDLCVVDS